MLQLRCLFWISEIVVVLLVIIPIARFLLYQWSLRELEFVNRFSQGSLDEYLTRFYAAPRRQKNCPISNCSSGRTGALSGDTCTIPQRQC
jgi:hypothetical protein